MDLVKPLNGGLGNNMQKATGPLGAWDSLNPCFWRDWWLHHHDGDGLLLCVQVCVDVSSGCRQLLYVKKFEKITLRVGLYA
jgi:hypothetical protein